MLRIDVYTKIILTVIALALVLLLFKPLFSLTPANAVEEERFSYILPMGVSTFFDIRTGDIYYYTLPSGEQEVRLSMQYRLEEPGKPLRRIR